MKKYKYHFSFSYWNSAVPEQISMFQLWIQGVSVSGFISTSMAHYELISQIIAGVGFALNLLGHFVYCEEIKEDIK